MNLLKKLLFIAGLSLAFLLAFEGLGTCVSNENTSSDIPLFSDDKSTNSAFIQPEIVTHFVVTAKADYQSFVKLFDSYLDVVTPFELCKKFVRSNLQDINRCIKVSLLLFPFHFFW